MIKINLIPEEERKRIKRKKLKRPVIRVPGLDLIISILLIIASAFSIFIISKTSTKRLVTLEDKITEAQKELKILEREKQIVESIQERQKELSKWVSLVQDLNKNRSLTVHLMDEINRLKPDYMWLVLFEERGKSIRIEGKTFSNLIISKFMVRLKESPYFTDIQLKEIKESKEKDQDIMGFVITTQTSH
ncbi:PilN domain-containing protein [candidate division WOR-3 bacterium]|nr:PilN domain-containing protein [candidate division WOR-3 bacterium]MCK4526714.1 PilN domain-containing protein [candidate division WOR-3 bacterium]